jgi:hypothetical protein
MNTDKHKSYEYNNKPVPVILNEGIYPAVKNLTKLMSFT